MNANMEYMDNQDDDMDEDAFEVVPNHGSLDPRAPGVDDALSLISRASSFGPVAPPLARVPSMLQAPPQAPVLPPIIIASAPSLAQPLTILALETPQVLPPVLLASGLPLTPLRSRGRL
ncbi:hypothetical protein GUJ93_ZPchr0002g24602 [Zizania palustris]|uniref:Uncharacterized protein n=1 Tax=Zizania palustris TaxID=103762 RepID=A0A8J5SEV4_ZIZPA|nr:hypothetical protein GUJ93_ZPchr0002g24602 [Zizania palustris]